MTTVEIKERIEKLNNARFFLAMKDNWTREDFSEDDKLFEEIFQLEKELKAKEEND